ncbi:MAG: 16S rRNA (guanine(966)-N(2))-methyltransferase RsmD [Candidatus Omnitrophica bacterium]|nr:16S rRNA (guanine(966)-N(2))-methyltransferase RsmD [Candidatus Omnitrophota bacterium]
MNRSKISRPTTSRIIKSLFDIIGDIRGFSFLDLFAGKGRVGIEALKRGAREVVFVEREICYIDEIKKNLLVFDSVNYRIITLDVFRAIKIFKKEHSVFDIIFLDPPYSKGVVKKTLKILALYDILAPCGFIIIQHYKKETLPYNLGDLILFRQNSYSETLLSFYQKQTN